MPTYFKFGSNYEEILDIMLGSITLCNRVKDFRVLTDHLMESDHAPISFDIVFSGDRYTLNTEHEIRFNFSKANWPLYNQYLYNKANNKTEAEINNYNIEDLNWLICKDILDAAELSIPKYKNRSVKSFQNIY